MKYLRIAFLLVVIGCILMSLSPSSSSVSASKARKLKMMKKAARLLPFLRKKYYFAVPFPLPIPIPLLKKTQPIIYKEKVAIPVPVAEPIAIAEPMPEPLYEPGYAASYEQPNYEPAPQPQHHLPTNHYDEPHY